MLFFPSVHSSHFLQCWSVVSVLLMASYWSMACGLLVITVVTCCSTNKLVVLMTCYLPVAYGLLLQIQLSFAALLLTSCQHTVDGMLLISAQCWIVVCCSVVVHLLIVLLIMTCYRLGACGLLFVADQFQRRLPLASSRLLKLSAQYSDMSLFCRPCSVMWCFTYQ